MVSMLQIRYFLNRCVAAEWVLMSCFNAIWAALVLMLSSFLPHCHMQHLNWTGYLIEPTPCGRCMLPYTRPRDTIINAGACKTSTALSGKFMHGFCRTPQVGLSGRKQAMGHLFRCFKMFKIHYAARTGVSMTITTTIRYHANRCQNCSKKHRTVLFFPSILTSFRCAPALDCCRCCREDVIALLKCDK